MTKPSDLVQGTLDMLILKILALKPLNGWALSQHLRQISSQVLGVSDGSLYPALRKLELRGWVRAQWTASENNRRAKVYWLTRQGRTQLKKRRPTGTASRPPSPVSCSSKKPDRDLDRGSTSKLSRSGPRGDGNGWESPRR